MKKFFHLTILLILATGSISIAAKKKKHKKRIKTVTYKKGKEISVPSPPFSEGIFPCTECHDPSDVNYKRRILTEEHVNIRLRHDEKNRWCLDCHSATKRDFLHLASGRLVSFKKSYILCGQCHGPKLRDWKVGVHGKRTGNWNGTKKYLLCVHCHNPHTPKFKKLKPLPPPVRQEDIK